MSDSTPASTTSNGSTAPRPGLIRRLYDWVLHWAYTPYAMPALFLLSFAESSFFPIPPDVLLLPLCLSKPQNWFRYASWCTLASLLGGIAGYLIGYAFWEAGAKDLFFNYVPGVTPAGFDRVGKLYDEWNFWIVFTAGFTPIPYKLITISAGVFHIDFTMFLIASLVGRAGRFYLVSWLAHRFGAPIREFIEKRLGLVTIVFSLLLVGGFVLVKKLADH